MAEWIGDGLAARPTAESEAELDAPRSARRWRTAEPSASRRCPASAAVVAASLGALLRRPEPPRACCASSPRRASWPSARAVAASACGRPAGGQDGRRDRHARGLRPAGRRGGHPRGRAASPAARSAARPTTSSPARTPARSWRKAQELGVPVLDEERLRGAARQGPAGPVADAGAVSSRAHDARAMVEDDRRTRGRPASRGPRSSRRSRRPAGRTSSSCAAAR